MRERCVWAGGAIKPDGSRITLKHCQKLGCNGIFKVVPPKFENCFVGRNEFKDEKGRAVKDELGRIV